MARTIFLLLVVYTCMISFAGAEPNTVTKYLLNEPVSLLDIGMHNLNTHLQNTKPEQADLVVADYNLNENLLKIKIIYSVFDKEQESIETAKAWCVSKIKLIKAGLGYMEDGRQIEKGWSIDSFFTHHNYTSNSEPKNLKELL
ncbi:MAG: hypothetical protein HYW13_08115, partial [Planctomycetes bacterium]|nr:hypothetical protein [Planctomycetota bacterium]